MIHGPMHCRLCWNKTNATQKFCDNARSKIVNDPGYWGAADPMVLVLGISKGNTQSNAMLKSHGEGRYDDVPFKGFRPRLLEVLQAVGLMANVKDLDARINESENIYGWASIMRCSLTGKKPDGTYGASSAQVIPAMKRPETNIWLSKCIERHVKPLSKRTRLVILLGNDEKYMKIIGNTMQSVFGPEYQEHPRASPVVFRSGPRFFVHVGHPSPVNGTLGEFLKGDKVSAQGRKREMARFGVAGALGNLLGTI